MFGVRGVVTAWTRKLIQIQISSKHDDDGPEKNGSGLNLSQINVFCHLINWEFFLNVIVKTSQSVWIWGTRRITVIQSKADSVEKGDVTVF